MILVAGSANLDFVVKVDHVPAPGETVLGGDLRTFPGGKGANQAIACARAGGVPTAMVVALGNDAFARPIELSLRSAGVDLHVARVADQPTGTAFICLAGDAENAITVAPGANSRLRVSDLPPLAGISHLLLQLETPIATVIDFALAARSCQVKVILNAAPAQPLPSELLAAIDVLIVNQSELTALTRSGSIVERAASIDVPCVVVTLGRRGCCARENGAFITQPAYAITPVDTTAAGDTFCGTLVAALSQGRALPRALAAASAAGALACTRLGAQTSIPTRQEVEALMSDQLATSSHGDADLERYCHDSLAN
jgi:ribokinase